MYWKNLDTVLGEKVTLEKPAVDTAINHLAQLVITVWLRAPVCMHNTNAYYYDGEVVACTGEMSQRYIVVNLYVS